MPFNVGGAGAGAVQGASLGSSFGAPGAAIGGILGGLGGGFFGGSKEASMNKLPTMTKEQQALLKQMTNLVGPGGQLGGLYGQSLDQLGDWLNPDSAAYARFQEPYMRQFNEQTIPGLAERFAGAGAQGGALSSSGFGQSLSAAGGNLQSQLAQMKSQLMQQSLKDIMGQYGNISNQALGAQPFAYGQQQAEPGLFGSWASQGFPGAQDAAQGLSSWLNSGSGGVQPSTLSRGY